MKNFNFFRACLCLVLFYYSQTSFAQDYQVVGTQTGDVFEELNLAIAPLDLSEVNSNHFVDKGMDIFNWKLFDGQLLPDSLAFMTSDWGWMYVQAVSSQLPGASPMPDPSVYIDEMQREMGDTIPIAALLIDYHWIMPDAIDLGLISYNSTTNTYHDVPNRPYSPYVRDTAVISVALKEEVKGQDVVFTLPNNLLIGNTANPTNIDLDYGAGWQSFGVNQHINHSFASAGEHIISIRYTLSNGSIKYAKFKITTNASFASYSYPQN